MLLSQNSPLVFRLTAASVIEHMGTMKDFFISSNSTVLCNVLCVIGKKLFRRASEYYSQIICQFSENALSPWKSPKCSVQIVRVKCTGLAIIICFQARKSHFYWLLCLHPASLLNPYILVSKGPSVAIINTLPKTVLKGLLTHKLSSFILTLMWFKTNFLHIRRYRVLHGCHIFKTELAV